MCCVDSGANNSPTASAFVETSDPPTISTGTDTGMPAVVAAEPFHSNRGSVGVKVGQNEHAIVRTQCSGGLTKGTPHFGLLRPTWWVVL
jgi:hypothetical protein